METFRNYIKPIYYFGKIFGIFQFSLSEMNKKKKTLLGRRNYFRPHLWSIPFVLFFLFYATIMHLHKFSNKCNDVSRAALVRGVILTSFCTIKFCVDFIWFSYTRKRIRRILTRISELSEESNVCFERTARSQTLFLISFIATGIFGVLNDIFESEPLFKGRLNAALFLGVTNYTFYYVNTAVKQFFSELNRRIRNLQQYLEPSSKNFNKINFEFLLIKIWKIMETHLKLTKISRDLNSAFSLSLLSNTMALFLFVTIFNFLLISLAFNASQTSLMYLFKISKATFWNLFFIGQLLIMVHSWESVAKEANETGLHFHTIWNSFEENRRTFAITQEDEIDTISLQLLQNKLKFTVCRFVDLDWSLIHLVIQTVTMYLVWIVQLKN